MYETRHYRRREDWSRTRTILVEQQSQVGIANTRGPKTLSPLTEKLGSNLVAQSLAEACTAEVLWLAVSFKAYKSVAQQAKDWTGRTIVDVMNAFGVSKESLAAGTPLKPWQRPFRVHVS